MDKHLIAAVQQANFEVAKTLNSWVGKMDSAMSQTIIKNQLRSICNSYRAQYGIEPTRESVVKVYVNDDNETVYEAFEWQTISGLPIQLEESSESQNSEAT